MATVIQPVVMCGGSGTRLWPLSRKALPKQFAPLIDGKSLLELTLDRLKLLNAEVTCIGSDDHRFMLDEAMVNCKVTGREILEPVGRGTAAAVAMAALLAEPDAMLLLAPADHYIADPKLFASTVAQGVDAALAGYIVTFGVAPSFPSTGYGYIEPGRVLDESKGASAGRTVAEFHEKPTADDAQRMLLRGDMLWNAGILLARADTLIEALENCAPDILASCRQAMQSGSTDGNFFRPERKAFESCRIDSIDYAVLEKYERIAVVPFAGAWSDVGSWSAVAAMHPADEDGNRLSGKAVALSSKNTFVHAPLRPVVALGTEDLVIIDTQDALLVASIHCLEQVKDVVGLLTAAGRTEATEHRRVARPWGAYDSIDAGERFQVKRLTVKPGAKLSLQMHHHRAEHWVVVKGTAMVTRDEETILLRENESVYIPLGVVHRLENPGKTMLEVIEVQSGGYLGEDDIVRFDDTYGRVTQLKKVSGK
ncbi:mannose-1-phosphate guanylyltransferase/mannose-6-phosphate isomerase [Variovorax sp. PAMC 28711]|uniref:mannose-1-phosphate guanylyltransferase/mannose-6-phosphate isomerase n=1 Tax=Variovorax sp. PAMC 28711 TaxID=1795631 RepID=UPI00078C9F72|nr:mannose-1-phosphate guanylyltransferase/mannose-6-phosphate isomerase [Variovorax sp. PAMC 28711]AMM26659.1 mannose-1-phosphate guanylyltransferase/mannose-6-phosphate isomerase [Variovorax sp. PAMC 28711]